MAKISDLIPSRRPITGLTASNVAQVMFDQLVAQWSLVNTRKIVSALTKHVKQETKRRGKGGPQ